MAQVPAAGQAAARIEASKAKATTTIFYSYSDKKMDKADNPFALTVQGLPGDAVAALAARYAGGMTQCNRKPASGWFFGTSKPENAPEPVVRGFCTIDNVTGEEKTVGTLYLLK